MTFHFGAESDLASPHIVKVDQRFLNLTAKDEVLVLLYGSQGNNSEYSNQNIINFVIKSTGRFDRSIFNGNQ